VDFLVYLQGVDFRNEQRKEAAEKAGIWIP
jgi:hypothetical protein